MESTKIALRDSRATAFIQTLIHVLPLLGAGVVLYLNFTDVYIGAFLQNISVIQFAAKIHELAMIASLTTILFTSIRYDLMTRKGLPFGALFSGLQITQISYLWSLEFWGFASSKYLSLRRRLRLVILIGFITILAATVGPSSAIAMIPRLGYWPAGQTHIWINGTDNDFWPSTLNASAVPEECLITAGVSYPDACPSSGLEAIANWLPFLGALLGPAGSNWANESVLPGNKSPKASSIQLIGNSSLRTLYHCLRGYGDCLSSMATTQQIVFADALVLVSTLWASVANNMEPPISRRDSLHSIEILQPFTQVICADPKLIVNSTDVTPVVFESQSGRIKTPINYDGITKAQLMQVSGNVSQPRLVFVDLPGSTFVNASLGAIILLPRDPNNDTQLYSSCVVSSGWGSTSMVTSTGSNDHTFSGYTSSSEFISPYQENSNKNYFFENFPLRHIDIPKEWAKFLDPFAPALNTSAFSALAQSVDEGQLSDLNVALEAAELILAALVTIGLANLGFGRVLQGNIPLSHGSSGTIDGTRWIKHNQDIFTLDPSRSSNSTDWVVLKVTSTSEGLAFNTHSFPVQLALAILLLYSLTALLHLVRANAFSPLNSSAWDSIAELVALAINSPPSEHLRNTCAGIAKIGIFRLPVRVVATAEGGDGAAAAHLQLVFGQGSGAAVEEQVRVNTRYGDLGGGLGAEGGKRRRRARTR